MYWILIIVLPTVLYMLFRLMTWTDTIFALNYNHGINVPSATHGIEIHSYRWFINICLDGNGSVAKCEMNRNDFENFLRNQQWCDGCYGIGDFQEFPETLIGIYPMERIELKSEVGDVLLVYANEIKGTEYLEISFYTDCN